MISRCFASDEETGAPACKANKWVAAENNCPKQLFYSLLLVETATAVSQKQGERDEKEQQQKSTNLIVPD